MDGNDTTTLPHHPYILCHFVANLWSCDDRKGYSPEDQHFLSILPNETATCHYCPTNLSRNVPAMKPKCPAH